MACPVTLFKVTARLHSLSSYRAKAALLPAPQSWPCPAALQLLLRDFFTVTLAAASWKTPQHIWSCFSYICNFLIRIKFKLEFVRAYKGHSYTFILFCNVGILESIYIPSLTLDKISPYNPGWPWICNPPASASRVLGVQTWHHSCHYFHLRSLWG